MSSLRTPVLNSSLSVIADARSATVALVLALSLLTSVAGPAGAQLKPQAAGHPVSITNGVSRDEETAFKQRVEAHLAAWSRALQEPEGPADFYAPDADLVFLDPLPPFAGYVGWREFRSSLPPDTERALFTLHEGLRVKRHGDLAWTIGAFHLSIKLKDGTSIEGDARQTALWQRRGERWLIVHMHESMPLPKGASPYLATPEDREKLRGGPR